MVNPNRVVNFKRPAGLRPAEQTAQDKIVAHERSLPMGGALTHLTRGFVRGDGREFKTIEAYREAWLKHRDDLTDGWIMNNPGTRPAAWWLLDCDWYDELRIDQSEPGPKVFGRKIPDRSEQKGYLHEHSELTPSELDRLGIKSTAQVA